MKSSPSVFLFLGIVGLGGCANSGGGGKPAPIVITPTVKIIAPADGSIVAGQPVTLSASFTTGANPTLMRAMLDGSDITAQFGEADANGIRTARVSEPAINYGKNQLQIRYDTVNVNSSFVFDTAKDTTAAPNPAPPQTSLSYLVPIKTRILRTSGSATTATDWGIEVGDSTNIYYSPVPSGVVGCNQGFQVLLLRRTDLGLVSNDAYCINQGDQGAGLFNFGNALQAISGHGVPGCGSAGCVLVIQSLYEVGYTPCFQPYAGACGYAGISANVYTVGSYLAQLGASNAVLFANFSTPSVGYSFIGNAGSGNTVASSGTAGSQFERLDCSGPPGSCDAFGWSDQSLPSSADNSQIGAISGALVRDNYNSFTFVQSAPIVHYNFGTAISTETKLLTNTLSLNGSTTEGAGQYTMALPTSSRGGFRLLLLNSTALSSAPPIVNRFYDIERDIASLVQDIGNGRKEGATLFLASMGDISHTDAHDVVNPPSVYPAVPGWNSLVSVLSSFGASPLTVKILGFQVPAFNNKTSGSQAWDDYVLVGNYQLSQSQRNSSGSFLTAETPPGNAAETGYVITRHTLVNAPNPTSVEGLLTLNNEGNYAPRLQGQAQGLATPQSASVTSASLLNPIPWPLPHDSNGKPTPGGPDAYIWLSNILCCSDIRAAYVNLNADPDNWLIGLDQLTYPTGNTSFTSDDFGQVQAQLRLEFGYLALVRNLQNNITNLYQSQQSNVGLILQQAVAQVSQDLLQVPNPPPAQPSPWKIFTTDVFPTLANLAGFLTAGPEGYEVSSESVNAIKTGLGLATMLINNATDHTNDPAGNSQTVKAQIAGDQVTSDLAGYAVNQYTESLVTLGNDFQRIYTDWGRLKTLGGPLSEGQLQWNSTSSGVFLRGFNLTTRREFYKKLMMSNNQAFFLTHIQAADSKYYGSDAAYINSQCHQSDFHSAQDNLAQPGYYEGQDFRAASWLPGALQTQDQTNGDFVGYGGWYWFDIWAIGIVNQTNSKCPNPNVGPPLANTFGMFDPIDPNNPSSLGLWKPYVFEQWPSNTSSDMTAPSQYLYTNQNANPYP